VRRNVRRPRHARRGPQGAPVIRAALRRLPRCHNTASGEWTVTKREWIEAIRAGNDSGAHAVRRSRGRPRRMRPSSRRWASPRPPLPPPPRPCAVRRCRPRTCAMEASPETTSWPPLALERRPASPSPGCGSRHRRGLTRSRNGRHAGAAGGRHGVTDAGIMPPSRQSTAALGPILENNATRSWTTSTKNLPTFHSRTSP
jgi:hypothetical protein